MELFDNYDSVLEHLTNIVDLNRGALGEESKKLLKELDNAAWNNSQNQLRSARTVYDGALARQRDAQAFYDSLDEEA